MKVAREAGLFMSHNLIVSSQLPLRNTFLRTRFQLTQYTCTTSRYKLQNDIANAALQKKCTQLL